jgi:deoxyribodipyrimidine photo-lyase
LKEPAHTKVNLFWFRRDLRLEDNAALFEALSSEFPVQPVFIFDKNTLDELEDAKDSRVSFIHSEVLRLEQEIQMRNGSLEVRYGDPFEILQKMIDEYQVGAVYANRDYEPYAIIRDEKISDFLIRSIHPIAKFGKLNFL